MILDVEIFLDNWIFVIHFWLMKNNLFIELDWSGISNLYLNMLKVWKISTWFFHCFSINSYKSQLFTRYSYWMVTPSIEEELMNYPRLLTNWRIIPILWRLRWRCHPIGIGWSAARVAYFIRPIRKKGGSYPPDKPPIWVSRSPPFGSHAAHQPPVTFRTQQSEVPPLPSSPDQYFFFSVFCKLSLSRDIN